MTSATDCGSRAADWCLAPNVVACTQHDENGDRRGASDTNLVGAHECDGRPCSKPLRVRRSVKLGCGCTRHECERHDGTAGVHFLTGGCGLHEPDVVVEVITA